MNFLRYTLFWVNLLKALNVPVIIRKIQNQNLRTEICKQSKEKTIPVVKLLTMLLLTEQMQEVIFGD